MVQFQPNCTIPPDSPVFVTAPNVRSTLDIVWSCTSTILLCCWSIQHLNVPPQFKPRTTRQKFMRRLFFFWRKVKSMLFTLFAPEALIANALVDVHSCRLHSPVLQELADEDGVPWSRTHTFLADMGGFALRFTPSGHPDKFLSTVQKHNQSVAISKPTKGHLQLATKGKVAAATWHNRRDWEEDRRRFRARVESASQRFGDVAWKVVRHNATNMAEAFSAPGAGHFRPGSDKASVAQALLMLEGNVWVLTAAQLIEARRRKLLARLPDLTEDEISDRNKGDLLFKLLALVQVSWMVIQIISRAALDISLAPIEVMTLSFTGCSIITYVLLLNHPQDVTTSTYIDAARLPTVDDMRIIADLSPRYYWFAVDQLPCVSNNSVHWSTETSAVLFYLGGGAGAALFGGIHLLAWNFVFPTIVERILWRTSSIVTILLPLVTILAHWQSDISMRSFRGSYMQCIRDRWLQAFTALSMLTLALARLILVEEAFRSLYYLPQDAYSTTWAVNLPYIS